MRGAILINYFPPGHLSIQCNVWGFISGDASLMQEALALSAQSVAKTQISLQYSVDHIE
jgi:hypothetical protein